MSEQERQSGPQDDHPEEGTTAQPVRVYPAHLYDDGQFTMDEIITAQVTDVLAECPALPDAPEGHTLSFEQASEIDCVGLIRHGRVIPFFEFKDLPTPKTRGQRMLYAAMAMQIFQEALIGELGQALQELEVLKKEKRHKEGDDGVACGV